MEQAQQLFELKPVLPDFYNILLERPKTDPDGYNLLFVDASQRANMGSSCSHSCASNCTSAVVARNGKLVIALTTNRHVNYGEELTMDYFSVTTSDVEWRASICLCGMASCRGCFLHYATQDDLQQVLNQNCGPLWRYASLLRACAGSKGLSTNDKEALERHGMHKAALGSHPLCWVEKYIADNLRFVEYERKALPCALMRPNSDGTASWYTFSGADLEARTVMEQRLQSMVCCVSMVQQVMAKQPRGDSEGCMNNTNKSTSTNTPAPTPLPVITYTAKDAIAKAWDRFSAIPRLMEKTVLDALLDSVNKTNLRYTPIYPYTPPIPPLPTTPLHHPSTVNS